MKTIQELYNEIMENQELKAKFIEAANAGKQEAFLKEQGCEATLEQVAAFLKAKAEEDAPLSLDELENSAGGKCNGSTGIEAAISVVTVGTICAFMAMGSAIIGKESYVGQRNDDDGRLCN
ncbi:MAG: hypothetical protein IKO25_02145 [Clostridia bacterium]|nr:hypothetical protein [Clostridia bacterium]